jgi:hypothetical protein
MSKIILSGDLSRFRPDVLVRFLETLKVDVVITFESSSNAQLTLIGGKIVGASSAANRGMNAMKEVVLFKSGTFSVRDVSGTQTISVVRSPDMADYPDNISLFKALSQLMRQGMTSPNTQANPSSSGTVPLTPPPQAPLAPVPPRGPRIGPMAKVPHLTDKGKATVRSIQTTFARGANVEGDKWKILLKINGELTVHMIGEESNILGDRLLRSLRELQEEGLLTFDNLDDDATKRLVGNFKFGEYMIAKGHITALQLESALSRQQELARKGRYMWLGEILVEMNFVRPSHVQEALAYQKRIKK